MTDMSTVNPVSLAASAAEYTLDRLQRTILFWDTLRKRGNNYLAHLEAGQPPILIFDHELVMDGRDFDRPVNYSLVRILDRRGDDGKGTVSKTDERRQKTRGGKDLDRAGNPAGPILIIDPRAGHGPGIGGSKMDSQIGIALDNGHPVYFVLFAAEPVPGQTIADVQQAEIRFLEKVAELHSDAPKPAVIGNCQAGWAAILIGADRPDLTGPIILNGSPLSYWGGLEGGGPMRYRGGLYGGIWVTTFLSDLGNGIFDGANLVAGFEDLNPANTLWTKYYHLFANVDTEEERFLNFEKWWGGFFRMNEQEIHFIVDKLFVGNDLEQGHLRLDDGRPINIKNIRQPIFAFASEGDNITPPPQALNWIVKVYGSVDEIKRCGQVIIYMVHKRVGHLGIFVSGSVARKEHREIFSNMGWLDYLKPGLYEMIIEEESSTAKKDDYRVRFAEREMADILKLDDGFHDERPFVPVHKVSRYNDAIYSLCVRPWLRATVNKKSAETLLQLHPLRVQRYLVSDSNPVVQPLKALAAQVTEKRAPAAPGNPFSIMEEIWSDSLQISLNWYRDQRDAGQEQMFKLMYENPVVEMLFGKNDSQVAADTAAEETKGEETQRDLEREKRQLRKDAGNGGFVEAAIRIMLAVASADGSVDEREFVTAELLSQQDRRLGRLEPEEFKAILRQQARLLNLVPVKAITALAEMDISPADRRELYRIAEVVAGADGVLHERQIKILDSLKQVLHTDAIVASPKESKSS